MIKLFNQQKCVDFGSARFTGLSIYQPFFICMKSKKFWLFISASRDN
jgi:hypothetical protein